MKLTAEHRRLTEYREGHRPWKWWGPYLSERAWGTVREDYGETENPWFSFTHDQARKTAYRWNEDGLMGICDREQRLCFAVALWNEQDTILKERLFGLGGFEGNHGEDVKEYYYYLDSTPTHSYMRMMYRYPQGKFPYDELRSHGRTLNDPELELLDTGIFDGDRFFDVFVSYAKSDEEDILIEVEVVNRGPEPAPIQLLPTLWFRNTWSWYPDAEEPQLAQVSPNGDPPHVEAEIEKGLSYSWYADGAERFLFTENENADGRDFAKDAFHRYVNGDEGAVNPDLKGTKVAALYKAQIEGGGSRRFRLRLCRGRLEAPFDAFEKMLKKRRKETDDFFDAVQPDGLSRDARLVQRQALSGMLLNKQFYNFDHESWMKGDVVHSGPVGPGLPKDHPRNKNVDWEHLHNFDIISMPDKWEYPWYATWDLAFHCLPLSLVDIDFAKRQLALFTREWYMHPNGQLPAYEWALGDANPPVHAWAAWHVYQMEQRLWGRVDRPFLESIFHKLVLNFTSWVNRKDADGNNIFQGGFLGLDNIGIFDRSRKPPEGEHFDQSDGTSWMAAYCLQMMRIALELAKENPVYEDMAVKFFEHFLRIARAMTTYGKEKTGLWHEKDGFFYDALHFKDGSVELLKVRSLVGLLPLFAVDILEPQELERYKTFKRRTDWFMRNRPGLLGQNMASTEARGIGQRRLVALLSEDRLRRVLARMLDKKEFLSEFGIRSLSRAHETPAEFKWGEKTASVKYEPAESGDRTFGGNSNWRGPIWFPMNYLIIDSLRRLHRFYGNRFRIPFPTGSKTRMNLDEIADALSRRLTRVFLNSRGKRPVYAGREGFHRDQEGNHLILFHEYFHGENGVGLGSQHQTGWTGLVANLLQEMARK